LSVGVFSNCPSSQPCFAGLAICPEKFYFKKAGFYQNKNHAIEKRENPNKPYYPFFRWGICFSFGTVREKLAPFVISIALMSMIGSMRGKKESPVEENIICLMKEKTDEKRIDTRQEFPPGISSAHFSSLILKKQENV